MNMEEKRRVKSPKLRNRFSSLQNNVNISAFNNLSGVYTNMTSSNSSSRRLPSIPLHSASKISLLGTQESSRKREKTPRKGLPDYVSVPVTTKKASSAEPLLDNVNSTLSHAMINFVQRAVQNKAEKSDLDALESHVSHLTEILKSFIQTKQSPRSVEAK